MTINHRCDYCGATYEDEGPVEVCTSCGEYRIYNIRESRPSDLYNRVGWEPRPPMPELADTPEEAKRRSRKQSKDLKAKRTSPEQAQGRKGRR